MSTSTSQQPILTRAFTPTSTVKLSLQDNPHSNSLSFQDHPHQLAMMPSQLTSTWDHISSINGPNIQPPSHQTDPPVKEDLAEALPSSLQWQ